MSNDPSLLQIENETLKTMVNEGLAREKKLRKSLIEAKQELREMKSIRRRFVIQKMKLEQKNRELQESIDMIFTCPPIDLTSESIEIDISEDNPVSPEKTPQKRKRETPPKPKTVRVKTGGRKSRKKSNQK